MGDVWNAPDYGVNCLLSHKNDVWAESGGRTMYVRMELRNFEDVQENLQA